MPYVDLFMLLNMLLCAHSLPNTFGRQYAPFNRISHTTNCMHTYTHTRTRANRISAHAATHITLRFKREETNVRSYARRDFRCAAVYDVRLL